MILGWVGSSMSKRRKSELSFVSTYSITVTVACGKAMNKVS